MGKRSNFERMPRDLYITPAKGLAPLLPFLAPRTRFIEPCAGNYQLAAMLEAEGHECVHARDLVPQDDRVEAGNALAPYWLEGLSADMIITNTPWKRQILHPMILRFSSIRPTWLLFDADWIHTTQEVVAKKYNVSTATELRKRCRMVVSVGRLKWIEGSPHSGMDNVSWYLFDALPQTTQGPVFIGP